MTNEPKNTAGLPVPPPLLMLIFVSLALTFGWVLPIPLPFPVGLKIAGWMIMLCGLGLAFSAVDAMRRVDTSPSPQTPTNQIAMSGPYLLSRNPIYLGFIAVIIGIPLIFGTYWGIIFAPAAMDVYNRLIIEREEAYLKRKFGQKYLDYMSKVRRWL